eukprot:4957348-Pyramimonas_sp.AAC.1
MRTPPRASGGAPYGATERYTGWRKKHAHTATGAFGGAGLRWGLRWGSLGPSLGLPMGPRNA